jgi:hypothetical protein
MQLEVVVWSPRPGWSKRLPTVDSYVCSGPLTAAGLEGLLLAECCAAGPAAVR